MAEIDNPIEVNMQIEEVKVVEAVSPRIISVDHVGNLTRVVIEDINGLHTLEIPDGRNGEKGDAGKTPVRGVDYWTPEDQTGVVESAYQLVLHDLGLEIMNGALCQKYLEVDANE